MSTWLFCDGQHFGTLVNWYYFYRSDRIVQFFSEYPRHLILLVESMCRLWYLLKVLSWYEGCSLATLIASCRWRLLGRSSFSPAGSYLGTTPYTRSDGFSPSGHCIIHRFNCWLQYDFPWKIRAFLLNLGVYLSKRSVISLTYTNSVMMQNLTVLHRNTFFSWQCLPLLGSEVFHFVAEHNIGYAWVH